MSRSEVRRSGCYRRRVAKRSKASQRRSRCSDAGALSRRAKILDGVLLGQDAAEIARVVGCSRALVYRVSARPDFRAALDAAIQRQRDGLLLRLEALGGLALNVLEETMLDRQHRRRLAAAEGVLDRIDIRCAPRADTEAPEQSDAGAKRPAVDPVALAHYDPEAMQLAVDAMTRSRSRKLTDGNGHQVSVGGPNLHREEALPTSGTSGILAVYSRGGTDLREVDTTLPTSSA